MEINRIMLLSTNLQEFKDSNSGGVGGGEILDIVDNEMYAGHEFETMHNENINIVNNMVYIRIAVYVLIILSAILIILKVFGVKSVLRARGMDSEFKNVKARRSYENQIIRRTKNLKMMTKIIEATPFKADKRKKDVTDYALRRTKVMAPDGQRSLTAEEHNARIKTAVGLILATEFIVALFISTSVGLVMMVSTIILGSMIPNIILRVNLSNADDQIRRNFADLYLMLHYILYANSKTPLKSVLDSYIKTTDSAEMVNFAEMFIHYINTYGEFEALQYVAKDYREIEQILKLTRVIRQAHSGGDIKKELEGFRTEILNDRKYALKIRMDKTINKLYASTKVIMIILFQAILSAASIYFEDMGIMGQFFG